MIWFTADTHFDHTNILKYEDRPGHLGMDEDLDPFVTTQTHNKILIEEWNYRVEPRDTIFHLGDVHLGKRRYAEDIMRQLNGHKILILGNHDRGHKAMKSLGFDEVWRWLGVEISGAWGAKSKKILLVHDPSPWLTGLAWWNYIICGHVHSKWVTKSWALNVGVDVHNFAPISLTTINDQYFKGNGGAAQWRTIKTPSKNSEKALEEIT